MTETRSFAGGAGDWARSARIAVALGALVAALPPGLISAQRAELARAQTRLEALLTRVPGASRVIALEVGPLGAVWVVTSHGVVRFADGDPARRELLLDSAGYRRRFRRRMDPITAAHVTAAGELWTGGRSGRIHRFIDGVWLEVSDGRRGPVDPIRSFVSRDGEVFAGGRGVWRWSSSERRLLPEAFTRRPVDALVESSVHGLVAASGDQVLMRRQNVWRPVWTAAGDDREVTALHAGSRGELLVGTRDGLARIDHRSGADDRWLRGRWVRAIAEGPGGALWIGTHDDGTWVRLDGHFVPLEAVGIERRAHVRALTVDALGRLWLALAGHDLYVTGGPAGALVAGH